MKEFSLYQQNRKKLYLEEYGHVIAEETVTDIIIKHPHKFFVYILDHKGEHKVTIEELVQYKHELNKMKSNNSVFYKLALSLDYALMRLKYLLRRC